MIRPACEVELLDFPHLVKTTLSKDKRNLLVPIDGSCKVSISLYTLTHQILLKLINQLISVGLPEVTQKKQIHPQLVQLHIFFIIILSGTIIPNISILQ